MPSKTLSPTNLILLTIALGLGTFIQILDSTVANVSIPYIASDLGVSPSEGTWIITSFAISNAIVLVLTGWLAKRIGHAHLFIGSTILFSLTSWLCGLAWNLASLVFFRILQGISAGALIPISQTLLLLYYPHDKRGLAFGFWGMVIVLAPIMGPVLGGYITDHFGWRWIFYINIPIGLFSAWLAWMLIGDEKKETDRSRIDFIGLLLLGITVTTLQILLDKGNDYNWFSSSLIQAMLLVIIICLSLFIIWNYYSSDPIVNFSFFKERNYTIPTLLGALGFLMFFGSTVLLPIWLETQMHYPAVWAGLVLMPIGIFPLLLSLLVGHYVGRIDPRLMTSISFLCFSLTFFWFSTINTQVTPYQLMLPRFFQGLGMSLFFIPLVTIALSSIPDKDLASASGLFSFIRLVAGGGIGTAVYVALWERWGIFHYRRLIESINPSHLFPSTISKEQIISMLERLTTQQAFTLAINDVFWMSGWTFLVLVPLIWFCTVKPTKVRPVAAPME